MIFDALKESADAGELILIDGGLCRWHLRRDGQITIREIIATRRGAGSEMLAVLIGVAAARQATAIVAKCPSDLPANEFYRRRGFLERCRECTKSGRELIVWALPC